MSVEKSRIYVTESFSFGLENLVSVALSYVLNPQGTSDWLKRKKIFYYKMFLFPRHKVIKLMTQLVDFIIRLIFLLDLIRKVAGG